MVGLTLSEHPQAAAASGGGEHCGSSVDLTVGRLSCPADRQVFPPLGLCWAAFTTSPFF